MMVAGVLIDEDIRGLILFLKDNIIKMMISLILIPQP